MNWDSWESKSQTVLARIKLSKIPNCFGYLTAGDLDTDTEVYKTLSMFMYCEIKVPAGVEFFGYFETSLVTTSGYKSQIEPLVLQVFIWKGLILSELDTLSLNGTFAFFNGLEENYTVF